MTGLIIFAVSAIFGGILLAGCLWLGYDFVRPVKYTAPLMTPEEIRATLDYAGIPEKWSQEDLDRLSFLADKLRQRDVARHSGETPPIIEPDDYEEEWQAEQERRADREKLRAERQAEAIARIRAEQAAINAEIPGWMVSLGRQFSWSSLEDLRWLKACIRSLLAHGVEYCDGTLSIREMIRAGIPGLPETKPFYEELSKALTRNQFLVEGKTGSRGRQIVKGALERI